MSVFFSYAFRPLFLLATLYALTVVPLWVAAWLGYLPMPVALVTPTWWHAHEMIYGFAAAAIGGFALTAVAAWTKRPPVAGVRLMLLSALWLIARVLFALPVSGVLVAAMIADLAYGVLLFALMTREVTAVRSERNYKVLLILGLMPVTNALFFFSIQRHTSWTMPALFAGLWLVVLMINLIGGRVIPGFTRNWLMQRPTQLEAGPGALPPSFDQLDLSATWFIVAFAILQLLSVYPVVTAAVGLMTSVVLAYRLTRWQGLRTLGEPLVWVLHLAYAWLPIGVLLLAFAQLGWVPRSAGIHALTGGAITTMILAIAGRAALGHTGRALASHPVLTASYVLITIAALCRVLATFGPAARFLLTASALLWFLGFVCFAWRYVPILVGPKAQSKSLPTI